MSGRVSAKPYGNFFGPYGTSARRVDARREGFKMTELSEDEEQSLDDALSTLDDL